MQIQVTLLPALVLSVGFGRKSEGMETSNVDMNLRTLGCMRKLHQVTSLEAFSQIPLQRDKKALQLFSHVQWYSQRPLNVP